jgi:DNA-binding GntR family transcriptional regulator
LEHRRVLEYIAEKDTSNAVKYMRQHVKALHKLMVEYSKDLSGPMGIGWL